MTERDDGPAGRPDPTVTGPPGLMVEAQTRAVLDAVPSYVILVDERHRIVWANRAVLQELGLTQQQVEGQYCPKLIHDRDDPIAGCPLEDVVAHGCPAACTGQGLELFERELVDRGRRLRTGVYPTPLVTPSGQRILVHTATDISEDKQLTEKLERNRDAQAVIATILQLSLEQAPVEEILADALDLVLGLPWLSLDKKGAVFLTGARGESLRLVVSRGLSAFVTTTCAYVPFGRCLCGRAAECRQVVFATGVDDRHDVTYPEMQPHGHYCVPMLCGGEVLGVLNTYLRPGHERVSDDEQFLVMVANTLAGIILRDRSERERKELLRKLRAQASELHERVAERTEALAKANIALEERIAAQARVEEELREAERSYRGIFENAVEGIFRTSAAGELVVANPALAHMLGLDSPTELLATVRNIREVLDTGPGASPWDEIVRRLEASGAVRAFDLHVVHRHRGRISLSINARRMVHEDGQLAGYEGTATDVTELRALELQRLQSQKIQSIGQLAAGIAHEINTPMQYINDNTTFLRTAFEKLDGLFGSFDNLVRAAEDGTLDELLVAEVKQAAGKARLDFLRRQIPRAIDQSLEGAKRVADIVRAMRQFSHPGAVDKEPVDLNEAIRTTQLVARNEWKYVAEMVLELDESLPLVSCVSGEMNQVLLNLIVNAAHAIGTVVGDGSRGKGTITIATRQVEGFAKIRISDTGCGIPEPIRARVFDPFFTTKEVGRGTGQGLAIARSVVVDKHRGTITFETEEDHGTTFIIRLPLRASSGSAPP